MKRRCIESTINRRNKQQIIHKNTLPEELADMAIIGSELLYDGLGQIATPIYKIINTKYSVSNYNIQISDHYRFINSVTKKFAEHYCYFGNAHFPYIEWFQNHVAINDKSNSAIYTMLESSRLPKIWVNIINKCYGRLYVPCQYLKDVSLMSGIKVPIFVIPIIMRDVDEYLEIPDRMLPHSILTFGTNGTHHRKNTPMLIESFIKLFGNNPKVRLQIHDKFNTVPFRELLTTINNKYNNINITTGVLSQNQMDNWYDRLDCYVLPTLGEGFSLTPRETLARGIPTLISSGHAHDDIIRDGAIGINKSVKTVPAFPYYTAHFRETYKKVNLVEDIGEFTIPDQKDMEDKMMDIYKNYGKYLIHTNKNRENMRKYNSENWKQYIDTFCFK